MPAPTIECNNGIWRVCVAGMCREHQQDWQAWVFYHQMISNYVPSTAVASLLPLDSNSLAS
jgi:hypothetical protein